MNKLQRAYLNAALFILFILIISAVLKLNIYGEEIEQDPSPQEWITELSAEDPEVATKALKKIYEAGERIIPMLIFCKGNRNLYWGYGLGDKNSSALIYFPNKEGQAKTHVTIEVAAIYLIEAIFRNDLEFAQAPFLVDRTKNKNRQQSFNSDAAISRAWLSINHWMALLKKDEINRLREKRTNPLFKSKTSFWGVADK